MFGRRRMREASPLSRDAYAGAHVFVLVAIGRWQSLAWKLTSFSSLPQSFQEFSSVTVDQSRCVRRGGIEYEISRTSTP